jgi:hypothetical protein
MTTINETILALAAEAREATGTMVGIRKSTRSADYYSVGETLSRSYRWVDGERTDQLLDGVSTVEQGYWARVEGDSAGDTVLVVTGQAEYGEDVGELVIKDACVYAVIDTKSGSINVL